MNRLLKRHWDRDYHTVVEEEIITSPDQVEDSWTGYNYWYDTIDGPRRSLNADEARKFLTHSIEE